MTMPIKPIKNRGFLKLLTLLIIWGGFFGMAPAEAQVRVSPLVIETSAERGGAQGSISLENLTDKPVRIRLYTEPFTYDKEQGFQSLKESPNDLSPYLIFSPREMEIPPGITRKVRMTVRLAPNLPDGEYRTALFTENLEEITPESGQRLGITARIGVTFYVRKGAVAANLNVVKADYNRQSNSIRLLVNNTGKATARPEGEWKIEQGGKTIQSGNIETATVIAEGERYLKLTSTDAKPLNPGTYQVSGQLQWTMGRDKKTAPFTIDLVIP